jgi:hypothetical protein
LLTRKAHEGLLTQIFLELLKRQTLSDFDPYSTLGVSPDAPDFVVQAAYRACIKRFHPDQYKGADARQKTAEILEAYSLIGNNEARAEFDRMRHTAKNEPPVRKSSPENGPRQPSDTVKAAKKMSLSQLSSLLFFATSAAVLLAVFAQYMRTQSDPEQTAQSEVPDAASGWGPVVEVSSLPPSPVPSQPTVPNLDEVLQFKVPSNCEMTGATEKLFQNLIIFDPPEYVGRRGPSVNVAGFEKPLVPSFSREVDTGEGRNVRDNEATLATAGTWHGLNVSKIRVRKMEQSSFWEHQIRFLEPASRVREELNKLGFQLPTVGKFREFTGPDVVSAAIGVEEIPGGSALYCGSSIYY